MSPRYCIACPNNSHNSLVSYFRFPLDENRCNLWKQNIGIEKLKKFTAEQCYRRFALCSAHFKPEDLYMYNMKNKLKRDAVPTIFESRRTIQMNTQDTPPSSTNSSGIMCAVKSCSRSYSDPNVKLFPFPEEPNMCKQWIGACDEDALCNNIIMKASFLNASSYRVCNQHFLDRMFYDPITKTRLRQDAYPVINLDKKLTPKLTATSVINLQPSPPTSTVNKPLDICEVFVDTEYAMQDYGKRHVGIQTEPKSTSDMLCQTDVTSAISTSLLEQRFNKTESCLSHDNNENGDSKVSNNGTNNSTLDNEKHVTNVEDTSALWHFNYLPNTSGFTCEKPRRARWFEFRSSSETR